MNEEERGVLITGATGLLGFHVAIRLANCEGLRPVCIVREHKRSKKKIEHLYNMGVMMFTGSFLDPETLKKCFSSHSIHYVVHLAALRGGGTGKKRDYEKVNVHGTESLLRESFENGVEKFIFCSSVGVFGTIPKELPARIGTELFGDNLYHRSKIKAEALVDKYTARGIKTYILRPTITYGLEDGGFPATLVRLTRNRRLILSSDEVSIHLLDADTFSEMVYCILSTERINGDIFIAADRAPVLMKDLVDRIHFHYHGEPYPSYLKIPGCLYKMASILFRIIKNEKWHVRVLLMSKSWHYDLNATFEAGFGFDPAGTNDNFIRKMCVPQ